jgi:hypothetical protein
VDLTLIICCKDRNDLKDYSLTKVHIHIDQAVINKLKELWAKKHFYNIHLKFSLVPTEETEML